jgi:uncharacterized damage-inducible protein DinB
MLELEIYRAHARYNRWMNEKLLAACAQLSDEERKRDLGAPFGSIHGLWNHILLADRGWLARFAGEPFPFKSLDEEICADFAQLRSQRAQTDDALDQFVGGLTPEQLSAPFSFVSLSNPKRRTLPLYVAVSHLFNHQTHHRGQITALLEQLGGDCGVTDLAAMSELEISQE